VLRKECDMKRLSSAERDKWLLSEPMKQINTWERSPVFAVMSFMLDNSDEIDGHLICLFDIL
jgi:hypothetical protein